VENGARWSGSSLPRAGEGHLVVAERSAGEAPHAHADRGVELEVRRFGSVRLPALGDTDSRPGDVDGAELAGRREGGAVGDAARWRELQGEALVLGHRLGGIVALGGRGEVGLGEAEHVRRHCAAGVSGGHGASVRGTTAGTERRNHHGRDQKALREHGGLLGCQLCRMFRRNCQPKGLLPHSVYPSAFLTQLVVTNTQSLRASVSTM
jgi:hypothetical protein